MRCVSCGDFLPPGKHAVDQKGNGLCAKCCAEYVKQDMIVHGKAILYYTKDQEGQYYVTDFSGDLRFKCFRVAHGVATAKFRNRMPRLDVHFNGPDGAVWYGKHVGWNNTLIHCKRIKSSNVVEP